jgi:signal-transduction protein with cAMP-binding, CBS, and nucleotidyltransferase domain
MVVLDQALEGLPQGLRDEIMFHICAGSVAKVPLFQSQMAADKQFLHRVVHMLTFESFPAGEYVFHKGEIGDCMYLISQGEVGIVLDEENPIPVKIIGQGDFFGEGALITLSTRTASILARTSCYLMVSTLLFSFITDLDLSLDDRWYDSVYHARTLVV